MTDTFYAMSHNRRLIVSGGTLTLVTLVDLTILTFTDT